MTKHLRKNILYKRITEFQQMHQMAIAIWFWAQVWWNSKSTL